MPDNKVALFIDFDNIRIGIRQHFGGELHPGKLMNKASKYGRVTTAKAYADFTGHPKEFQDRLLFAAGIEPIHAPSKVSGGRRQSSADMHMVIDMFLEAIDHEDVDTFVLMTGDADFVRMVATLRRRFGRKVIISGVQSTSTSLDLLNSADARDPITKADCDMIGELGRMSRPLVTRADLEAQAEAGIEPEKPRRIGGILGGLFKQQKPRAPLTAPAERSAPPPVAARPVPPAPAAPRRIPGSALRPSTAGGGSGSRPSQGRTPAAPRAGATAAPARGQQRELPPVGPGSQPDQVEQGMIRVMFQMPPGRMGFTTMKTIEEVLRSKAGVLGTTRKEIPTRLERLETMGLLKRESRQRGSGHVEVGELVRDHPTVTALTQGLVREEQAERPARLPRQPRAPRAPRPGEETAAPRTPQVSLEETGREAVPAVATAEAEPAVAAAEAEPTAVSPEEPAEGLPAAAAPATDDTPAFRWVSGVVAPEEASSGTEEAESEPAKRAGTRTTRKPAAKRKPAAAKSGARTTRSRKKPEATDGAPAESTAEAPAAPEPEPEPQEAG